MCLYPKLIKNRKYTPNKKNGGIIPAINDKRVMAVPVGCGKCMECKKKKARDWQVRLYEEIKDNKNGIFITLTFSNESIKELSTKIPHLKGYERDNEIATIGVRMFLERWRKKHKKSVRHWLVTELGHEGTENIHMHGFIWTDHIKDIEEIWKYGYVWIGYKGNGGYVNERTINYCTKYVHKQDNKHKEYNSKILTSNGIGKGYTTRHNSKINKYNEKDTQEYYITRQGYKIALPIYYRNKIYNDEEKEKLWIQKIDEGIRYVNGIKINAKNNNNEYFKTLEQERLRNKRLGYGNNAKNWERKKYEEERRNLMFEKRIENKKITLPAYTEATKEVATVSHVSVKPLQYEEIQKNMKNIW